QVHRAVEQLARDVREPLGDLLERRAVERVTGEVADPLLRPPAEPALPVPDQQRPVGRVRGDVAKRLGHSTASSSKNANTGKIPYSSSMSARLSGALPIGA